MTARRREQHRAIFAQALYLGNLLALPGILFLVMVFLYFRFAYKKPNGLAAAHIRLATAASLLALALLGGGALVFWLAGNYQAGAWAAVLLYLLIVHTSFVMFGIIALARAMAEKTFIIR